MAAAAEDVSQAQVPEDRPASTPTERLRAVVAGSWTPDTLEWLRNGFSLYVLQGTPLEEALELKPASPGKPPPRRELNRQLRDSLICALVEAYGDVKTFLDNLYAFETRVYPRWSDEPPPTATEEQKLLHLLLASFEVPRSRSAIYSITRPTD